MQGMLHIWPLFKKKRWDNSSFRGTNNLERGEGEEARPHRQSCSNTFQRGSVEKKCERQT